MNKNFIEIETWEKAIIYIKKSSLLNLDYFDKCHAIINDYYGRKVALNLGRFELENDLQNKRR